MMNVEQRANLNFLVWFGKTSSEALTLQQQVYGKDAMSRLCVFEWHKRFKEGCEDLDDDANRQRPSSSRIDTNVELVRQRIHCDH